MKKGFLWILFFLFMLGIVSASYEVILNETLVVSQCAGLTYAYLSVSGADIGDAFPWTGVGYIDVLSDVNSWRTRACQKKRLYNRQVDKLGFYLSKYNNPTGTINFTIRNFTDDSVLLTKNWGNASNLSTILGTYYEVDYSENITINDYVYLCLERDNFTAGSVQYGHPDDTALIGSDDCNVISDEDWYIYNSTSSKYILSFYNDIQCDMAYNITFVETDYPTDPYITLDGIQVWNYSGVFNTTENTDDFASSLLRGNSYNFLFYSNKSGSFSYESHFDVCTGGESIIEVMEKGGGFSAVLKAWNPEAYEQLGYLLAHFLDDTSPRVLGKNIRKFIILMLEYIFRQPASLVQGEV